MLLGSETNNADGTYSSGRHFPPQDGLLLPGTQPREISPRTPNVAFSWFFLKKVVSLL